MVILVYGDVETTVMCVASGVSGSMMIGLVEEPRTVKPPDSREIHV
jgi:hypothetical protein